MTTDRDRILSEFIDSWNAGRRPDLDEHLARVSEEERAGLLQDITSYTGLAPTPDYDEPALSVMREESAPAFANYRKPAGLWPALLPRWRRRASLSVSELAASLVESAGLEPGGERKAQAYLERIEAGNLEPSGFSQRLLDGLARVLNVPRERLESAGGGGMGFIAPRAAPQFRASEAAAEAVRDDLELMADAMAIESQRDWDEVDELFRGGR